MPVRSPYPDVEVPEVSLFDFLFRNFGERADAAALVDGGSGATVTFSELERMVLKIAAGLAKRGIGAGDVVGLYAPNTPLYPAVFHGVLRGNSLGKSASNLLFDEIGNLTKLTYDMPDNLLCQENNISHNNSLGVTQLSGIVVKKSNESAKMQ